jgi:3-phenylpropionate/trans-cinnamate dioxygenase alpha subunit
MLWADEANPSSLPTQSFMATQAPEAVDRLGDVRGRGQIEPVAGTIFPNLSFNLSPMYPNLRMWMPRGPHEMEVWVWALVDADVDEVTQATLAKGFQLLFGVSGLLEQDDGDQWQAVTAAAHSHMARNRWSSIGMGLGREFTDPDLPGELGLLISESNLRSFYRRWQDLLRIKRWDDMPSSTASPSSRAGATP